jgi:hypothetical protein
MRCAEIYELICRRKSENENEKNYEEMRENRTSSEVFLVGIKGKRKRGGGNLDEKEEREGEEDSSVHERKKRKRRERRERREKMNERTK